MAKMHPFFVQISHTKCTAQAEHQGELLQPGETLNQLIALLINSLKDAPHVACQLRAVETRFVCRVCMLVSMCIIHIK